MSTLTPSGGYSRRRGGALPVILVGVLALAIGAGVGWYLTNREPAAAPAPSASGCPSPSSPTATVSPASGSPAASGSPVASRSPKAPAKPRALPKASTITVDVYNATDRQGLAKTTAKQLEDRGFIIGRIANDPKSGSLTASAEVRYGKKGKSQAKVVAAQVPGSTLVVDKRTDKTVSLAIGEAYSGLATPEQVAVALAPSPSPTC